MNKKAIIAKNSIMGLVSQGTNILFTFVTRSLFINYIGIELMALNSTFLSILNTLSLAELGFQSAIIFSLYKPLHDGNTEEVNSIMNILRLIYRCIGIFFIVSSFLALPLLKYIINGIEITNLIYIYFLLQSGASTCTYFLAYKRTLLYADQKEYISKTYDLIINIVFNILQCAAIIYVKNYIIYLALKIIQVYASNILVHIYCNKHYSYFCSSTIDKRKLKEIFGNVKNIFIGKIAGYIYSSTDNLVVSIFTSTIKVGFLANYTTIIVSLKSLIFSVLSPMIPIIGNYIVDEDDTEKVEESFLLYSHIRYIIAIMVVVPVSILIDEFITMWVGSDMIMNQSIIVLLLIDLYIHIVHSSTSDYINGYGMFKQARNIDILGAISNIVTSIILVQIVGISGVLTGTVISQIIFWFGRSYIVYSACFKLSRYSYIRYWLKNIIYIIVTLIIYVVCNNIVKLIVITNPLIHFIASGICCELIIMLLILFVYGRTKEQKQIFVTIKNSLGK